MDYLDDFGVPNSVDPPTKYLTFGYWIYMVPQYKPEDILMLGYAGGTVAGLVRLLYGDVPIVAVDIDPIKENRYGVEFVQADAKEFVKTCKCYDCVVVDVSPNDKPGICDFVSTEEFARDLSKMANYIIVNTYNNVDMSAYSFLECVGVNQPSGLDNKIYYYQTIKIPNLRVFE